MQQARMLHHRLPSPFDQIISQIVLEEVENADYYIIWAAVLLTALAFIQLKAFARPPPVPLKKLPRRPALNILFKPDDITSTTAAETKAQPSSGGSSTAGAVPRGVRRRASDVMRSIFRSGRSQASDDSDQHAADSDADAFSRADSGYMSESSQRDMKFDEGSAHAPAESPFLHSHDLPDSFAPLLSSSQMEILRHQLTADLIHAVQVKGGLRLAEGQHEIPLDKDSSRPQFRLDVPKGGCRWTVRANVGSDGLTSGEDLDVERPSASRSRPMVKDAGITLDPPLPLSNVAPTLIHFPTLFEDKFVPTLRRIQIVRFAIDLVTSFSSFIEKMLWIVESKCQIHLSKVQLKPLYKGSSENNPDWRLRLSFSGHVLVFGWIPIPFVSVILPTFIIPHPHALLEYLLSAQPLASAKIRRENIAEQKIALAVVNTVDTWNIDIKTVATPPALGIDIILPGGMAVAMEIMHGRDAGAGIRKAEEVPPATVGATESVSGNSMSSWTTVENTGSRSHIRHRRSSVAPLSSPSAAAPLPPFDANALVPWSFELAAKGSVSHKKITVHILKCMLQHEDKNATVPTESKFITSGSLAIWKADLSKAELMTKSPSKDLHRRTNSFGHLMALTSSADSPSVAEIFFYPQKAHSASRAQRMLRMLQYDYTFDVWDDSQLDAITLSVGASHPMITGGSMVTTILESIYAFGTVTAREGATLDPSEATRKRNILRHLPAVEFTFGIQNFFIPVESMSFSDDGQTKLTPELEFGRVMVRVTGGTLHGALNDDKGGTKSNVSPPDTAIPRSDGIKLIADFGVGALALDSESKVNEFAELDIFEGTKLRSVLSGELTGRVSSHLRPQMLSSSLSTTGPNIFNPLEAYEIDFSGSSLSYKVKESTSTLGHRRVIIPTESTIAAKVIDSVVDMTMEGRTNCELSWDFQGLSPILQVTQVGESPAHADHEHKQQVSLLISPLRQGRINFRISPVGGIAITKAKTLRDDKEGLFDWKFFNALVSPDHESAERLLDVIHDRRTMEKLLQVMKLINTDLHKISRYVLTQVWRAKDIFDQEGVSDPGHLIPEYKMARMLSLFLCGDVSQVDVILPIIKRVVAGDGLDIVKVKDLLRQHLEQYDIWAPEIDRGVRWAALMLGAMPARAPLVEASVPPLAELPQYSSRLRGIPSAKELYDKIHDKPQLPLDPNFSNLVSYVAPYLSLSQVEYFLKIRASTDWQPSDLRRLRYIYSIKRKVREISESYGGLTFLPQSFLVSVFLGEATRASLRATRRLQKKRNGGRLIASAKKQKKTSTLTTLRRRRMPDRRQSSLDYIAENEEDYVLTPAGRVASKTSFADDTAGVSDMPPQGMESPHEIQSINVDVSGEYELGDSLLGPQDVAILLQAGLTSAMKGSTVVQLNQRMLLDLIASQPDNFAGAVLAEIGTPGGQGSPRGLTSALMALLELDQSSFTEIHRLDMHALLESWLPGFQIPRLEDYLAGGRRARQSYYEAIYHVATDILDDAECYIALKGHLQRSRKHREADPIPGPKESADSDDHGSSKLNDAIARAKAKIKEADKKGVDLLVQLVTDEKTTKKSEEYKSAIATYQEAFEACSQVLRMDKLAFQSKWFRDFYRRNFDALMVKSMHDNVIQDVDNVREWLNALRRGPTRTDASRQRFAPPQRTTLVDDGEEVNGDDNNEESLAGSPDSVGFMSSHDMPSPFSTTDRLTQIGKQDNIFSDPSKTTEQALIDAIVDATVYRETDRERLRKDPLVRLLIPNPPGKYNFTIVTAMGVITEGKSGLELEDAFRRLKEIRGVSAIRADTGTARSLEYNASKIEEAIYAANQLGKPFGLLGYSQGCANALTAESLLLSGSPEQQRILTDPKAGLVCRQLLFSAANGSMHGPASDSKVQRLFVMCEEFFKYQQGYFSRAFTSTVLELLNTMMDSAAFHKFIGGAQSMLPEGCRAFWREAQHLSHIPTCTMRGVLEEHTTPECLEMVSSLLTKQSGSALHDSQVHVYDAVGHPIYTHNRNGRILKNCAVGEGAIQRTHHWSPLSDEVEFVRTSRDVERCSFDCAKDRHVFPWVDVNVRFGFIHYDKDELGSNGGSVNGDDAVMGVATSNGGIDTTDL